MGIKVHLKKQNIDLISKIKFFKPCVMPVLIYGAQTYPVTEKTTNKLEITKSHVRSILNIKRKDRIKNEYNTKNTIKKYNIFNKKIKLELGRSHSQT